MEDPAGQCRDEVVHRLGIQIPILRAVGAQDLPVGTPGRLDLNVLVACEQLHQKSLLSRGEQPCPAQQSPSTPVDRVTCECAVYVEIVLDAPAASIESIDCQVHHMEGIHHGGRLEDFLGRGGGESVHLDDLQALAPGGRMYGQPRLQDLLGSSFDDTQKPGWAPKAPSSNR